MIFPINMIIWSYMDAIWLERKRETLFSLLVDTVWQRVNNWLPWRGCWSNFHSLRVLLPELLLILANLDHVITIIIAQTISSYCIDLTQSRNLQNCIKPRREKSGVKPQIQQSVLNHNEIIWYLRRSCEHNFVNPITELSIPRVVA